MVSAYLVVVICFTDQPQSLKSLQQKKTKTKTQKPPTNQPTKGPPNQKRTRTRWAFLWDASHTNQPLFWARLDKQSCFKVYLCRNRMLPSTKIHSGSERPSPTRKSCIPNKILIFVRSQYSFLNSALWPSAGLLGCNQSLHNFSAWLFLIFSVNDIWTPTFVKLKLWFHCSNW